MENFDTHFAEFVASDDIGKKQGSGSLIGTWGVNRLKEGSLKCQDLSVEDTTITNMNTLLLHTLEKLNI